MTNTSIYLIQDTDAYAIATTEAQAAALESVGFRRVTHAEYQRQVNRIAALRLQHVQRTTIRD